MNEQQLNELKMFLMEKEDFETLEFVERMTDGFSQMEKEEILQMEFEQNEEKENEQNEYFNGKIKNGKWIFKSEYDNFLLIKNTYNEYQNESSYVQVVSN